MKYKVTLSLGYSCEISKSKNRYVGKLYTTLGVKKVIAFSSALSKLNKQKQKLTSDKRAGNAAKLSNVRTLINQVRLCKSGALRPKAVTGPTPVPTATPRYECSDGIDNDNDGFIDYPFDPDCDSPTSQEAPDPAVKHRKTYAIVQWQNLRSDLNNPNSPGIYSWTLDHPIHTHDNIVYPWVLAPDYGSGYDPVAMKRYVDQLPIAAIFSWTAGNATDSAVHNPFDPADHFDGSNQASPFMNSWLRKIRSRTDQIFSAYRAVGGTLDTFTMDIEELGWGDTNLVRNDPRFNLENTDMPVGSLARGSMASKMGDFNALTCPGALFNFCGDYWSMFMLDWGVSYVNEGIFKPINRSFPEALVSNFNWFQYDYTMYRTPMFTNVSQVREGFYHSIGPQFGSAQQVGVAYGRGVIGNGSISLDGRNPFAPNSFNALMQSVYAIRGAILSDPSRPMTPLFGGKRVYNGYSETIPREDDYYAENVFHGAMGAPHVSMWTEPYYMTRDDYPLGEALAELDQVAGTRMDKQLLFERDTDFLHGIQIASPHAWSRDFIYSCVKRNLTTQACRFTFREYLAVGSVPALNYSTVLRSEHDANGNPEVTFMTRSKKIVFAGGRVIHPAHEQSDKGYWVVMPLDAQVTLDESTWNTPPTAIMDVLQTGVRDYEVLIFTNQSHDDDGYIVRYDYDFNDDGVFGDGQVLGGIPVGDPNTRPNGSPTVIQYTYDPNYVAPGGTHTVAVRMTDNRGAVTTVRSAPFSFSRARCPNSDLWNGSWSCPITHTELVPGNTTPN